MELATALSSVGGNPSVPACLSMFGFPDSLKTPAQHHLSKNIRTDELRLEKKWRKTKAIDTQKQSMARSNGPNSVKYLLTYLLTYSLKYLLTP